MTKQITPGVVINFRGNDVTLTPKNYTNTVGAGLSYKLDSPVDLGQVSDIEHFINDSLGGATVSLPNFDNLPSVLKDIKNKISSLHVIVEQFDLNIPPDADATATTTYTVGLAAMWAEADVITIPVIGLKIRGAFLQVIEDGSAATPTPSPTPTPTPTGN